MSEEMNPFKTREPEAYAPPLGGYVAPSKPREVAKIEHLSPDEGWTPKPPSPDVVVEPKATSDQCRDILELVADLEGKVLTLRKDVDIVSQRNSYLEAAGGIAPTTHLALSRLTAEAATKTTARRCTEILLKHGVPAGDPVLAAIRAEFGL